MSRPSDKDCVIEEIDRNVARIPISERHRNALRKLTTDELCWLRDYIEAVSDLAHKRAAVAADLDEDVLKRKIRDQEWAKGRAS